MTTLANATSWWVPKLVSGTNLVDQKGSNTFVSVNTPTLTNDGTYNISQLRAASSQYYEAADAANLDADAGDYSIVLVTKPQVGLSGTKILYSKRFGSNLGYNVFTSTTTPTTVFDDDVSAPVQAGSPGVSVGTRYTLAVVKSGTSLRMVRDGTAGTSQTVSSNSIANGEALRVNRGSGTTTSYADQDLYGIAWFKGIALTDAETVSIGNELLAATAIGGSTVTAVLTGTSASSGTATAVPKVLATAAGTSSSAGAMTATPKVLATLAGSSASSGSMTAVPKEPAVLAETSASAGSATFTVHTPVLAVLAGTSASSGAATATVTHPATLTGTSASSGAATATPTVLALLAGSSASSGAATFTVAGATVVTATLAESSTSHGTAVFGPTVLAVLTSTSGSSGTATAVVVHLVTAASTSVSAGHITANPKIPAVLASVSVSAGTATFTATTPGPAGLGYAYERTYTLSAVGIYNLDSRRSYQPDNRRTYSDA